MQHVVDIADIKCRSTDVIFALGLSSSVTEVKFEKMKSFVLDVVDMLHVQYGKRVGVVSYAGDVRKYFNLNAYSSVAAITSAISSFTYDIVFGRTNTVKVLAHVRTVMLTRGAGDRPAMPNVVVIMTDETSDNMVETQVCTLCKYLMKNFIISETILKLCCT